jgi:hypothetical protein
VREALVALRHDGGSGAIQDRLLPFTERQRLVGLPALEALAQRYAPETMEAIRDA